MTERDYQRIESAIRFLQRNATGQPGLAEVAAHVGLSAYHFQRMFHRWAGITPKGFLQAITLAAAKRQLHESRSVLDTSFGVGLSGPSRLHDLFIALEAMTPGEYKAGASGLSIEVGVHETPFGAALFAATSRGLCGITFLDANGRTARAAEAELRERWPGASFARSPAATAGHAAELARRARGEEPRPLTLLVKGTHFQVKVWEALLRIPSGALVTYGDLARAIDAPAASRAVGAAVGQNSIAWLIPCHRVIRSTGVIGDYRWGSDRKRAILGAELARAYG
jgi:AraC family transcriptional regulator of adaptative response/methylated-DNA-[protein]-cysteine methyltransferase